MTLPWYHVFRKIYVGSHFFPERFNRLFWLNVRVLKPTYQMRLFYDKVSNSNQSRAGSMINIQLLKESIQIIFIGKLSIIRHFKKKIISLFRELERKSCKWRKRTNRGGYRQKECRISVDDFYNHLIGSVNFMAN